VTTRGRKGKLIKSVMVISNDPKTPQFELKISADVQVLLSLEPDHVFMNQIPKGGQQTQTIKLVGSLADKAKILSVESNRPELKAVPVKGKPEIQLTLRAPDKPERINATVTVTTDQEVAREITLPVSAEVTAENVQLKGPTGRPPALPH
jgi:hypothetical protein